MGVVRTYPEEINALSGSLDLALEAVSAGRHKLSRDPAARPRNVNRMGFRSF